MKDVILKEEIEKMKEKSQICNKCYKTILKKKKENNSKEKKDYWKKNKKKKKQK